MGAHPLLTTACADAGALGGRHPVPACVGSGKAFSQAALLQWDKPDRASLCFLVWFRGVGRAWP